MARLLGEPITPRDLERVTGTWRVERFTALCDAVTWASSGGRWGPMPTFTGRVRAADGGVDAEWDVDLEPRSAAVLSTPVLGAGWNVLQYKQRDVGARDRARVVADLKRSLDRAVVDVTAGAAERRQGRPPDRYVLFTNVDLTHDQARALRGSILRDAPSPGKTVLEIVSAGVLAALLNDQPHLRAAFFGEDSFCTWHRALDNHLRAELARTGVERLVGREEELTDVRSWAEDTSLRALVVTGPPGIGKSRLVLEGLEPWKERVVVALDPRSADVGDYRALVRARSDVFVVVEDPSREQLDELVALAMYEPGLRMVLTLPTPDEVPNPSFGHDPRLRTLPLGPLSPDDSRTLLRATGAPIDPALADWIVAQSGGLPSILLTAAAIGPQLRETAVNLQWAVGRELERRVEGRMSSSAVDVLSVLSVLTFVGVRGDRFGDELDMLSKWFGLELSRRDLRDMLDRLSVAGLVSPRGSFAAVAPPMLANHLAGRLLRDDISPVLELAASGDASLCGRFADRLSQLPLESSEKVWEMFFESGGLLHDLRASLGNASLLRRAAVAVPDRVLSVLDVGLRDTPFEVRMRLAGPTRRTLMEVLEELLVHPRTSRRAVRLLWRLAEAENETWGNNATGVLAEVFHPMHPQVSIPVDERLPLARELFAAATSSHARVVLVEALGEPWQGGAVRLRMTGAAAPAFFRSTYRTKDVREYMESRTALLFEWAENEDVDVQRTALSALPPILVQHIAKGLYDSGLSGFETLVGWIIDRAVPLSGTAVGKALNDARWHLEHRLEDDESVMREATEEALVKVDNLLNTLTSGSVLGRLQVWAARWETQETLALSKGEPAPFEDHLGVAADELIADPTLLDEELTTWLTSPAAGKGMAFFQVLGERDEQGALLPRMAEISRAPTGSYAFGAYMAGWRDRDATAARAELDRLVQEGDPNRAPGAAYATIYVGPSPDDLERLVRLLATDRVDRRSVAACLGAMGTIRRWIDGLEPSEYERLLQALVGNDYQLAVEATRLLARWHAVRDMFTPGMVDLGWECLSSEYAEHDVDYAWDRDSLAAALTDEDPERAFSMLEPLMSRSVQFGQGMLEDAERRHAYLDALARTDRPRLLRLLIEIARRSSEGRYRAAGALRAILGDDEDLQLLIEEGAKSIENAYVVAEGLDIERPDVFWPVAFALVEAFPADESLKDRLAQVMRGRKLEPWGASWGFWGSEAEALESYRVRIEARIDQAPPAARAWLRDEVARLSGEVERKIIWEHDEDVADLRGHLEDPNSPRRMWAIGRILKYADWSEARRLLTLDDLIDALPRVDLPPQKRRALERAVEVWRSETAVDR